MNKLSIDLVMKTKSFIIAAFLLAGISLIFYSCNKESIIVEQDLPNPILKKGSIPAVNGQGTILYFAPEYPEGMKRHFSIHASLMPDGGVKGNGVLHFTGGERDIKFDISCMHVNGNTATLSGIITYSSVPEYQGTYCYVRVVDNGEGNNDAPDKISLLYVDLQYPVNCAINLYCELFEIGSGNIQVKP